MPTPLHSLISEKLRHQILSNDYQAGQQLPSEHQLMAEFSVSRITVRRAIANLVTQGLVVVHQGKGAFVADRQKVTYSLSSPLIFLEDDMARQGIKFSMQTLLFERVSVSDSVQQILQLPATQPQAYLQKKLLLLNGIPGCLDITYILPDLGHALSKKLKQQMTFPTLEQAGILIDRIEAILECTHADAEASQYLDVPLGHALITYRHTAYATDNRPIVHGESISRGDRFCYAVNVFRNPVGHNSQMGVRAQHAVPQRSDI